MFKKVLSSIPEYLARFTLGFVFIESGLGKLKDIPKIVSYFESLHIPFASIQAPFVSALELICGIFILLGVFTRASSLFLISIMTVAIVTAKWGDDVTDISSLLGSIEFLYIVILSFLLFQGSKSLSGDSYLRNKIKNKYLSLLFY